MKKCKKCENDFTPHKYATSQTKCKECIFAEQKEKLCVYRERQLVKPKKPQKPIKLKIDKEWKQIADFIKKRDAGNPCISCEKQMKDFEIQAGHFISRAKSSVLYYDKRNIHAQCWECNNNHQKQQETQERFRNGLIARYGIEYVEILEEILKKEWEIKK